MGTGFATPQIMAAFDRAGEDRRVLYDASIVQLINALEGKPVNDDGDLLNPPAHRLRERLWEGPSTSEHAVNAGRRGSGFSSRASPSAPETGLRMSCKFRSSTPIPTAYRLASRRIGLSRAGIRRATRRRLPNRTCSWDWKRWRGPIAASTFFPASGIDGLFARRNIHTGSPDAVIASLSREPLLTQTTDLICQVQPGLPSPAQTLDALELIATEVAPALGWRPTWTAAEAFA